MGVGFEVSKGLGRPNPFLVLPLSLSPPLSSQRSLCLLPMDQIPPAPAPCLTARFPAPDHDGYELAH